MGVAAPLGRSRSMDTLRLFSHTRRHHRTVGLSQFVRRSTKWSSRGQPNADYSGQYRAGNRTGVTGPGSSIRDGAGPTRPRDEPFCDTRLRKSLRTGSIDQNEVSVEVIEPYGV